MRNSITRNFIATVAVGFLGMSTVQAFGQTGSTGSGRPIGFDYAAGGYGSGYHSSTAAEGFLRGAAAVREAQGRFNRDSAAAAIDFENARTLNLANRKQAIDTYYQAREMNRQHRASERGQRLSTEALYRLSKDAAPKRLTRYELDPVFGGIFWPAVLQDERFAAERTAIENLFRHRDQMTTPAHGAVDRAAEAMGTQLKGLISYLKPSDYLQAKNFLASLSHEARLAPAVEGVASMNVVSGR